MGFQSGIFDQRTGLGVSPLLTHRVFDEDGTYHTFVVTHYKQVSPEGLFTQAKKRMRNFDDICEFPKQVYFNSTIQDRPSITTMVIYRDQTGS